MLGTLELWKQGVSFYHLEHMPHIYQKSFKNKKKSSKYSSLAHLSHSQEVLLTLFVRYGLLYSMAALSTPSSAFSKVLVPCYQQASVHVNTACISENRD
jgi:hypothetical protein